MPGVLERAAEDARSGPSAASSAMPATAGGSTSGSSIRVISSARPRNVRVASRYAAGVPTSRITASAIALVSQAQPERVARARRRRGCRAARPGSVSTKIATTGSVRNDERDARARPTSSAGNQARGRSRRGPEARLAQRGARRRRQQPVDERARRRRVPLPFTTATA